MMQTMVPSTRLLKKHSQYTTILYNDKVSTMAYVVDRAFSLSAYIMDRVLNMWWVGFWTCVGFININMSYCSLWTQVYFLLSSNKKNITEQMNSQLVYFCIINCTPDVLFTITQ